jgi:hypothetical protein
MDISPEGFPVSGAPAGATGELGLAVPGGIPLPGHGRIRVSLRMEFRDRDGKLERVYEDPDDPFVLQLAQALQSGLLAVSSLSVKNTSGTSNTTNAAITSGTVQIAFGTGVTAEAFTDYAVQTAAGGTNPVSATVSSITNGATSGTFTVTATWNNTTGITVTISELSLYVGTVTGFASNPQTLAYSHDVFTGQAVGAGGTAAATLTVTVG